MPQVKGTKIRPPPGLEALRPDDMLSLRFSWIGLERKGNMLTRVAETRGPVAIIVGLGAQHIAEEAFFEAQEGFPLNPAPITPPDQSVEQDPDMVGEPESALPAVGDRARARLAGPSQLAFLVPKGVDEISCTLEALLRACWEFEPSVVGVALPPPARTETPPQTAKKPPPPPKITRPARHHTAIEAPWRLVLSPSRFGTWLHRLAPLPGEAGETGQQRIEVWHTRLAARAPAGRLAAGATIDDGRHRWIRGSGGELSIDAVRPEAVEHHRIVRAIWSPDYSPQMAADRKTPPHKNEPFRMSLDAHDRHELVALTSNFEAPFGIATRARVVRVRALMLSALGASLDLDYNGERPTGMGLAVESWRHRGTWGRDHYVRVVYAGYLLPFGHRASLVKVTERKFQRRTGAATDDAFLRQRMYLVIRRAEMRYPAPGQPAERNARGMPLRSVRLMTLVTPNLNPPEHDPVIAPDGTNFGQAAFWPNVATAPFPFPIVAHDWEGRRVEFTAPLMFVSAENNLAFSSSDLAPIIDVYNGSPRRQVALSGQKVAYAEAGAPGDTALETATMTLGAESPTAPSAVQALAEKDQPAFYPVVAGAKVAIPGAAQLTEVGLATIKIAQAYIETGWTGATGDGKAEVFADVDSQPLGFSGDRAGGVALPNMSVRALSRAYGPLGGSAASVTALAQGAFKPTEFFQNVDAKLLGGIDLTKIMADEMVAGDGNTPALTSRPISANGPGSAPQQLRTLLTWQPELVDEAKPFVNRGGAALTLKAEVITDLAGGPSTTKIHGTLTKFSMNLFGFIVLPFDAMTFDIAPGRKPTFDAKFDPASFGGPLNWVNELSAFLGQGGDPPPCTIDEHGLELGFSLEIPTLAAGVLTIQNINFGGRLSLPFNGDAARLRFDFCTREQPFVLTVIAFGGGGFFGIAIGLDGVEAVETALEFGASVAVDIGVASGEVHLLGGIYFSWTEVGPKAELTGYVRLGGSLCVMGVVSVSVEFDMKLSYLDGTQGGTVWGQATLIVEVEILMVSESVELTVRREFSDPPRLYFHELTPEPDWASYLGAFAPLAA